MWESSAEYFATLQPHQCSKTSYATDIWHLPPPLVSYKTVPPWTGFACTLVSSIVGVNTTLPTCSARITHYTTVMYMQSVVRVLQYMRMRTTSKTWPLADLQCLASLARVGWKTRSGRQIEISLPSLARLPRSPRCLMERRKRWRYRRVRWNLWIVASPPHPPEKRVVLSKLVPQWKSSEHA